MTKATLISHTQDAAALLIFTKSTRLNLSPSLFDEIKNWPKEKIDEQLEYMAKTIKSSWEFIDVTFLIEGVTRACAQQITRTRNASYAMQSQRVLDARDIAVSNPYAEEDPKNQAFDSLVSSIQAGYALMVDNGSSLEDARGILPMNTQCNLAAKYNLRSLSEVIKQRKSLRAQGEYADIADQMEKLVIGVWPWTEKFFQSDYELGLKIIEGIAKELGVKTGTGPAWELAKAVDLIRKAS